MNLEELKARVRAVEQLDWRGETIWLRKLSAKDGLELFGRIKAVESDESRNDRDETLAFHVEIVARTLANEKGELVADSDEGRETLKALGFDELTELGTFALERSGFRENGQKKS